MQRSGRGVHLRAADRRPDAAARCAGRSPGRRHGRARSACGANRVFLRRSPGGDRRDRAPGAGRSCRWRTRGGDRHPAPHGSGIRRDDLRRARSRRGTALPLRRASGAAGAGGPGCPQPVATPVRRTAARPAPGVALPARHRPYVDRLPGARHPAHAASGALGGSEQGTGAGQGLGRVRRGAELPRATCLARRRRRTHQGSGRGHARVARRGTQSGRCRPPGAGRGNVATACRPVRRSAGAPPAAGGRHPCSVSNRRPHPQAGGARPGGHRRRRRCRHPGEIPAGRRDRDSPGDRARRLLPAQRRVRRQRDELAPVALSARVPDRLRRTHLSAGDSPGPAAAGCRAGSDQPERRARRLPAAQGATARRGAPAVRAGLSGGHRTPHPVLSAARHQFHQRAPAVELSAGGGGRSGRRIPGRRGSGAPRR